eukprot:scaffold799_cov220-Pinguiococcus_pyrenoidosus.AAC.3
MGHHGDASLFLCRFRSELGAPRPSTALVGIQSARSASDVGAVRPGRPLRTCGGECGGGRRIFARFLWQKARPVHTLLILSPGL